MTVLCVLFGLAAAACSGGSAGGGTGGSSGNGGNGGPQAFKPCAAGTRVGGFSLQLIEGSNGASYSSFGGGVKNGVDPREGRVVIKTEGSCQLTSAPVLGCTPACTNLKICGANKTCIDEPAYQSVGTLTLTGLPTPVMVMPPSANQYYADLSAVAFPPFTPGAAVTLSAAGGMYTAFSLSGRGIDPLKFAGTGLDVSRNKALSITWTEPSVTGAAQIFVRMDIAHHGGGTARIECDVPDTGSTTIPAGLINQLLDMGMAGFPTLSLTRRTVDSTSLTPGCVDLLVASPVERPLTVEGVISCNCNSATDPVNPCEADGLGCPVGQICRAAGSPGGLTCGSATAAN